VYQGFPFELLSLVRCADDGGALDGGAGARIIDDGIARCTSCSRVYRIERGILRLLDRRALDAESVHEADLRDSVAAAGDYVEAFRTTGPERAFDRMEMRPTLAALAPLRDRLVLELGAGTGRYTVELVRRARAALVVDFSARSLETLAAKIDDADAHARAVGLVQADVTRLRVAPRRFDRVFSTLMSNLPTRAHRDATYRLAASALRDDGVFVFSTHHYGWRQRVRGEPIEGRYTEGGIYRRLFTRREVLDEVGRCFDDPRSWPIQIALPFTYREGFPLLAVSTVAERLPLVSQLGSLLLATARRPRRDVRH
jgi:SAM-dependent methyltransferase